MKELTRTRRLIISSIIFVFIIVIGLITFNKPDFEFKISLQETLDELYNIDNEMIPEDVMDIIAIGDSSFVMIDLRNQYDFEKGHLGEAINIPVTDILNEESIAFFEELKKDSIMIVLYANDQIEANASWMMLKQLGYDNVKILLGGYNYFTAEVDFFDEPEIPEYFIEEPYMNFAEYIENMSGNTNEVLQPKIEEQQIIPVKRKKKVVSEGGC
jgi:rhodanese-related sulfurtransferase